MPLGNQSVEGLPVFGLDFFFGVLKAFEHFMYTDPLSICQRVWDIQVQVPALSLLFAVTEGKPLRNSVLSFVSSLSVVGTNKFTLSFIIRPFWS